MDHQDWETFIIHCKTPKNDKTKKETKHHEKTKDRKIEEMEEKGVLTHKKVETSLSKIIPETFLYCKSLDFRQIFLILPTSEVLN